MHNILNIYLYIYIVNYLDLFKLGNIYRLSTEEVFYIIIDITCEKVVIGNLLLNKFLPCND